MSAKTHPCVFRGSFIREQIDPRVAALFPGRRARFGELRRLFRERECQTINPYGSDSCPYSEQDCAMSFLRNVEFSVAHSQSSVLGYFRAVCKSSGARRADEKPLTRDREPSPRLPGGVPGSPPSVAQVWSRGAPNRALARDELAVRRRLSRPIKLGDLFARRDDGARDTGVRADGEEGGGP